MEYFLSAFFILIACEGNFLSNYEIWSLVCSGLLLYVGTRKRVLTKSDFRLYLKFGGIYLIYILFRFYFINHLSYDFLISDINFFVDRFTLAFLFCAVMRESAVYYMAKVTYNLAFLSIILYIFQLTFPALIFHIGGLLRIPLHNQSPDYVNFLFFTYDHFQHPHRNSGFAWEPGAYGYFLDMGLLLYFLINKFVFDRKVLIFVLAIITTLSTTTYLGFLVVALIYLRVNGVKLMTLLVTAVPIFAVVLFKVPFLVEKIVGIYYDDMETIKKSEVLAHWYIRHGGGVTLNRFGSILFIYDLFGDKLILGVSNAYLRSTETASIFDISNGIMEFIAKFGVVGLIYMIQRYVVFIRKFLYSLELAFYCVLLLLVLGFGEPILLLSNTLTFMILSYYVNPKEFFMKQNEALERGEDAELIDEENEEENEKLVPAK